MTQARSQQVSVEQTPYYHCISRCVRRAFLCGEDQLTGTNYEYRKIWIVDKLKELNEVFAINLCAYTIMSNHYHVILHVDADRAKQWDEDEVIARWRKLFGGGVLVEQYLAGQCKKKAERDKVAELIQTWRTRLMDISWFIRCLNESIARQANKEDNCKGRFWEGRFKSQALLDELALLACMVYVDLNPLRAGVCKTLEKSDYSSIQQRLLAHNEKTSSNKSRARSKRRTKNSAKQSSKHVPLHVFVGGSNKRQGIPFEALDYLELAEWSGRAVQPKKKGAIPDGLPKLLSRLGISKENWIEAVTSYEKHFSDYVGQETSMKDAGASRGLKWLRGSRACQRLFSTSDDQAKAT